MSIPAIREIVAYAVFKEQSLQTGYDQQLKIYAEPKAAFKAAVATDGTLVPIRIIIGETSLSAEDATNFILEKLAK